MLANNSFAKCSLAHVVISFTQSRAPQRSEPRPTLACDSLSLSRIPLDIHTLHVTGSQLSWSGKALNKLSLNQVHVQKGFANVCFEQGPNLCVALGKLFSQLSFHIWNRDFFALNAVICFYILCRDMKIHCRMQLYCHDLSPPQRWPLLRGLLQEVVVDPALRIPDQKQRASYRCTVSKRLPLQEKW